MRHPITEFSPDTIPQFPIPVLNDHIDLVRKDMGYASDNRYNLMKVVKQLSEYDVTQPRDGLPPPELSLTADWPLPSILSGICLALWCFAISVALVWLALQHRALVEVVSLGNVQSADAFRIPNTVRTIAPEIAMEESFLHDIAVMISLFLLCGILLKLVHIVNGMRPWLKNCYRFCRRCCSPRDMNQFLHLYLKISSPFTGVILYIDSYPFQPGMSVISSVPKVHKAVLGYKHCHPCLYLVWENDLGIGHGPKSCKIELPTELLIPLSNLLKVNSIMNPGNNGPVVFNLLVRNSKYEAYTVLCEKYSAIRADGVVV
jgi:hypothetical protein